MSLHTEQCTPSGQGTRKRDTTSVYETTLIVIIYTYWKSQQREILRWRLHPSIYTIVQGLTVYTHELRRKH